MLLVCLLLAALGAGGCRDAGLALGRSPAEASGHADALLYALAVRFGVTEPAPGYPELRARFARSALVPSRLYDDSSVWTGWAEGVRDLQLTGRPDRGGYLLGSRAAGGAPRGPGEYRRATRLRSFDGGEFEWTVRDELAVGPVAPDGLAAVLTLLLRGLERTDAASARAAATRALPASAESLGRLLDLDSLALAAAPGGTTRVFAAATLHPERIADEFPRYSRFLQRYVPPARVQLTLEDARGVRWWHATVRGEHVTFQARIHDGRLAPLTGPPRPMPDQLRLRADLATRIRIFAVGISDLHGDVSLTRTADEKAFRIRFAREPEWHLPLLVERLIRTPLRRPFEDEGATLGFAARQTGASTLLVREYQLSVQESAIVRWFGGLGSTALGDFRDGAEEEYDRFNGQLLSALRADARALLR